MAIKADLEATISELGEARVSKSQALAPGTQAVHAVMDELILDFISQWLEAKHKQQKAWALEQGVLESFEAFLQSTYVLPAIFWNVVAKGCSEPREQVDAIDVTRSTTKVVPVSSATTESSFRNLVSAFDRLRANDKTSAAETAAARLFRSKEHIDQFKLQPLRTKRFATLLALIRICSVAFTLLRSVKDGGRGHIKSAQDRLQLCAILCVIIVYSGCRPGDALRARGYLDNVYALLCQDATFFYRVIQGVKRLCVHIVLRTQEGRKDSPRARRAFIAYSHAKLSMVVDLDVEGQGAGGHPERPRPQALYCQSPHRRLL